MNNTMVVKVRNGGEGCTNKVCSVRFVVASFPTYAVEKLAAESEISDEVDYWRRSSVLFLGTKECWRTVIHCLEVINQRQDVLVAH